MIICKTCGKIMAFRNQWGDVEILNVCPELGDIVHLDTCDDCDDYKKIYKNLDSKDMFT